MKKNLSLLFFLGLVLALGFVIADNNCVPNMNSNEYYGTVYVGPNPLTGGNYTLVAMIDGSIVGARRINTDGTYDIDVSPCPGIKSGAIEFFIGDQEANESGDNEYDSSAPILVSLDLHLNKDPHSVCGNSELNRGEECDDGNGVSGDGCSYICEVELGYECSWDPNNGSICTMLPYCGDATCNNGETCTSCPTDCGACPSSGGGGGGGGSSSGSSSSGGGGGGGSVATQTTTLSTGDNSDSAPKINETNNLVSSQKTTDTSTNFLTGAFVGVADFAKTGKGKATLIIITLIIIAGVFTVLVSKKKNFTSGKKKSEKAVNKKTSGKRPKDIRVVKLSELNKRKKNSK